MTTTAVTAPLLLVPLNGEVLPTFVPATATVALAEKVGSAMLCAVTRPTPAVIGAVNTPAWVIVPIVVDHVTASLAGRALNQGCKLDRAARRRRRDLGRNLDRAHHRRRGRPGPIERQRRRPMPRVGHNVDRARTRCPCPSERIQC